MKTTLTILALFTLLAVLSAPATIDGKAYLGDGRLRRQKTHLRVTRQIADQNHFVVVSHFMLPCNRRLMRL